MLIDTVFKPRFVHTKSEHPEWNYISDIIARWHRGFFYFVSVYACPAPNALSPSFEVPFTRLRHVADGVFDLGYMRHTEEWHELYFGLSQDEAFRTVQEEMHFWPAA